MIDVLVADCYDLTGICEHARLLMALACNAYPTIVLD